MVVRPLRAAVLIGDSETPELLRAVKELAPGKVGVVSRARSTSTRAWCR